MIPLSVLDLAFVPEGATPADALANSVDLARHAEALGYRRFWLAEHHNMVGVASAATAVVIGHVAANTREIRVGAGGVMLPNHAPLIVAEQFGTLETLYPGRIDLGLGRAPGTDPRTTRALRRSGDAEHFPQDVLEVQAYLGDPQPGQVVQAVPGSGTKVPLWILGSSLYGAQLAASLGLPYAFASHFAPDHLLAAVASYGARFQPSLHQAAPYAMIGVNVVAADTDSEARRLFTSAQQQFTNLVRGTRGRLPPPVEDIEATWAPHEKAQVSRMLARALVGSRETVARGLAALVAETGADEILVASAIHDPVARRHSYTILAEARDSLTQEPAARVA